MKKTIKIIALLLLFTLLIIQFVRIDKNESGYESVAYFEKETKAIDQIKTILKNNCYDCHSNQTIYPWYSEVAPISFWLSDHVAEGKEHFNVSDWEQYTNKKKDHKLEELLEEVEECKMPLNSYTWMHGNLNDQDKEILIKWTKKLRNQYSIGQ